MRGVKSALSNWCEQQAATANANGPSCRTINIGNNRQAAIQ